jgi:hypothetical protein
MARVLPDGWEALESANAAPFETATLRRLAAELPDDYSVFHGVHWTRLDHGCSVFGEIDFIVMGPHGQVVLIEQKSGALEETPEGLVKRYPDKDKRVASQMQRSIHSLQLRFSQAHPGKRLSLEYLLYCPDYVVRSPATAGIAGERIVDARQASQIAAKIVTMMKDPAPANDVTPAAIRAFLSDELDLAADPSVMVGQAQAWVTRLSGGLAKWARALDFTPFRLRVIGTAGSGKTQLALRVLEDAAANGRRARYVCFNRPLADHLARLVPPAVEVTTFHMLGDRKLRARGAPPDFREPGVFDRLADAVTGAPDFADDLVDVLVIDEGQDFEQPWAEALLRGLKPDAAAWWLEDPMQNLYDRPAIELPGWVTLRADQNFRTPRDVLRQITLFVDEGARVLAASPIEGDGIDIGTYHDFTTLANATVSAIGKARAAGFKPGDIVVLTYCGRDRSLLMSFDRLGAYSLRRFDGTYDDAGNPNALDGDVLVETVFRFKGQSAPCVILTEIDFEALDEQAVRRLYVGATRARMRLAMVMSERAERQCVERLR